MLCWLRSQGGISLPSLLPGASVSNECSPHCLLAVCCTWPVPVANLFVLFLIARPLALESRFRLLGPQSSLCIPPVMRLLEVMVECRLRREPAAAHGTLHGSLADKCKSHWICHQKPSAAQHTSQPQPQLQLQVYALVRCQLLVPHPQLLALQQQEQALGSAWCRCSRISPNVQRECLPSSS